MNVNEFLVILEIRIDSFLSEKTGKSRSFVQEQIKSSRVKINGEICLKPSHRLKANDVVSFEWKEETSLAHLTPTPGTLNIVFEDEYLLALNKSAGVIVHPGAGRKDDTLVHHLLHYLNHTPFNTLSSERPGIVHRLDEGTTGVLLVAKTEETQVLLSNMFKNRSIKKTYRAITYGKMHLSGTFNSPIGRDRRDRKKMSSRSQNARPASTPWKALERFQHFTYVELYPTTGRTHQLRVHLSEAQFPIVGDPTYGKPKMKASLISSKVGEQISQMDHTLLHAYSVEFEHPHTHKVLSLTAPLPEDFAAFLHLLKQEDPCQP